MKRWKKVVIIIVSALVALVLIGTLVLGVVGYFGPFRDLAVMRIQFTYRNSQQGGIIFYGASNFALWPDMKEDMEPFTVQNHGFGGSADDDLMRHAGRLLYPFRPSVVVFQSGSNDFVLGMTAEDILANKDKMYTMFRKELPDTTFVVLSMLPLPERTEYWEDSIKVNEYLREYCDTHANMLFVDATDIMLSADGKPRPDLFKNDGIHLNREGQILWGALIKQALVSVVN